MHEPKITVIGSSNTDMIVKVPRIPMPGETILGGTFMQAPGGKGANQAVAAARNGGAVTFIANLGDDHLGRNAIEGFQRDGIHTDHILIDSSVPSGVALIFVGAEGENSIAVASGANGTLTPNQIASKAEVIRESDLLLMQLETPLETIESAAKIAKQSGVLIVLNPAPAQPLSESLLQKVDFLTPNETEAELLTGIQVKDEASATRAAQVLLDKGIGTCIITLGAKGAFVSNKSFNKLIPGFKVRAVDATAAGDTFNGVFAVGLASGKSIEDSVRMAHAAAACSVTKMGAQTSIPNWREINEFLSTQ